jgi:DNA-binding Xre family transcriptional regulator
MEHTKEADTMRRMTMREDMTPIDKKCIEQGITRTELSRRSGVPIRTLEAWGKRIRIPRDVYVLQKVAQALNCSIEEIIEPEPKQVDSK